MLDMTLSELAGTLGIHEGMIEDMRNEMFESRNLDPLGAMECDMVEDTLYEELLEMRMDYDMYLAA